MGPLSGIRVVDLSLLLPGPLCTMHLADMGAEVIKVENPRMPDLTRLMGDPVIGVDGSKEGSIYLALNRNKKAITINLKRPEGRQVLHKVLANADVLIEGFRPNAMTEMELGYDQLKEKYPGLIYCSISGYGANGPYKDLAGHDGNYIAYAGLLDLNGGENPVVPGVQIADVAGGTLSALSSILAALYYREKTGKGQHLDIGMIDGAFSFMILQSASLLAKQPTPERGNTVLSGAIPNYNVYQCKDGKFVMLGALEERFFRTFLRQVGKEDLLPDGMADPKELKKLFTPILTELFRTKNRDEWQVLFEHPDCCLAPVKDLKEAFEDPQLQARGMIVKLDHPNFGELLCVGSPFKFSATPVEYNGLPPSHGQHTSEILSSLGYSETEIAELRSKRAI